MALFQKHWVKMNHQNQKAQNQQEHCMLFWMLEHLSPDTKETKENSSDPKEWQGKNTDEI